MDEYLKLLRDDLRMLSVDDDIFAAAMSVYATCCSPMGYPPIEAYGHALNKGAAWQAARKRNLKVEVLDGCVAVNGYY